MLECRTYSYAELSALLHTRDRQGIVRRFERWEVKYTTTGRGTGQKFAITEIGNPFKVYCILDLGFSPQTDFTKLAFFTYYLLCDDEFQQLPSAQMEEYLRADGHTLSRQTISNYLLCLEAASLVCRGFDYGAMPSPPRPVFSGWLLWKHQNHFLIGTFSVQQTCLSD